MKFKRWALPHMGYVKISRGFGTLRNIWKNTKLKKVATHFPQDFAL